jgi:hypothetical protein
MMGASKYVGVPSGTHQDAPKAVAVAAAVDDDNRPPLATATKVPPMSVDGPNEDNAVTVTVERGEVQPPAYRDKWFAIAFIAHLLVVLGTGMAFGPAVLAEGAEAEEVSVDVDDGVDVGSVDSLQNSHEAPPKEYWFAVVTIALMSAPALSFVALTIMSR